MGTNPCIRQRDGKKSRKQAVLHCRDVMRPCVKAACTRGGVIRRVWEIIDEWRNSGALDEEVTKIREKIRVTVLSPGA